MYYPSKNLRLISSALFFCLFVSLSLTAIPTAAESQESSSMKRSIGLNEQALKALNSNNLEEAETLLREAIKIDPGNLTAAFNLAGVLVVNLKKDDAISILKEYTSKYPKDAGLFVRLGDITFSSENIKQSIEYYIKAFKLEPKYPRLAAKLGLVYALNQDLKESEKYLRKATEQDPEDSEALGNLSSVLLRKGAVKESIEFANRSIKIKPTAETYITLGSGFEASKKFKKAEVAFRKALELGAKNKELEEKIQAISKLEQK